MPKIYKEFKSGYSIDRDAVAVSFDEELKEIKEIICEILKIEIAEPEDNVDISFVYDEKADKNAYSLSITENGAKVYASSYEGAFYALTTLRQLYKTDITDNKILTASCLEIKDDKPLYEWRGLHLDESRNFFGVKTVKKLLDFMSLYKLNRFHWHLTDDQGWRIEVKKYPLLTEIGSKRTGTQLHSWSGYAFDDTPHEGHYTQK
jgi:hexosaminidase